MLTITVVHAPGGISPGRWAELRRLAPGAAEHELRVALHASGGTDEATGPEISAALRSFLFGADAEPEVQLSTAGRPLADLDPGSALLHPGMVVLVAPPGERLRRIRRPGLSLCVESGPDAGQLISLRRGSYWLGRGHCDIQVADPELSRRHALIEVSAQQITVTRASQRGSSPSARPHVLDTDSVLEVGYSTLTLAQHRTASNNRIWPPSAQTVEASPPEGRHRMMLATACIPLVVGLVLVAVTGMWFFLIFSIASAALAAGVAWDSHRRRRRFRHAVRHAATRWALLGEEALRSAGLLALDLRTRTPERRVSGSATYVCAEDCQDHPDQPGGLRFPVVRIGHARILASVEAGSATSQISDADAEVMGVAGAELAPGRLTLIHGNHRDSMRLMRWFLLQLVVHPLRPNVLMYQLPHAAAEPLVELQMLRDYRRVRLVDDASSLTVELADRAPGVLVCAGTAPDEFVTAALASGWHVLTCEVSNDQSRRDTSAETASTADRRVCMETRQVTRHERSESVSVEANQLIADGLSLSTLEILLREAVPEGSTDSGLAGLPETCSVRVPAPWWSNDAKTSLVADLGQGREHMQSIDLVSDGPHLLIGGTTGSGKSELLRTLLVSLASRYGPEEVNLALIDFKGGATFHQLAQLEHCLTLVTDLSRAQAERTLEGLRSELIRREKLFLAADVSDYAQYRHQRPDSPLARILVVIDEFRVFAHELPDAMDELMRLATLGRSLGLHLILSTQRPQGVVTADIRANIGTSISLRVRSEEESRDLIGGGQAAAIPARLPGRGFIKRSGEPAREFQTAQLILDDLRIQVIPEKGPVPAGSQVQHSTPQVLETALVHSRRRRPHTPLLPPLPDELRPADALKAEGFDHQMALLGRVDDPAGQDQRDLSFDPQDPHSIAFIGEPSAGAAAAVCGAVCQFLQQPDPPYLYLLDGDMSLTQFAERDELGCWLTPDEMPEVQKILGLLTGDLSARRAGQTQDRHPVVIVVTGWSQWAAKDQFGTGGSLEQQLGLIAAEGSAAGMSLMICGGRELAVGKLVGRIPQRVYLPFGSSQDITYLWPKLRSSDSQPGRGVLLDPTVAPPGLQVQLITAAQPPTVTKEPSQRPPLWIRPLPQRLPYSQLMDALAGHPEDQGPSDSFAVGIEQFTWRPVRLKVAPVTLIVGSPGTGKTSCLRLFQQLSSHFLCLAGGNDWGLLPQDQIAEGSAAGLSLILVDDAERCSSAQHQQLQEWASRGAAIVATASPSATLFSQLPWAHPARYSGGVVFLSPVSRSETDAVPAMMPLLEQTIPGRAVQLRPEGPRIFQWAFPEPDGAAI